MPTAVQAPDTPTMSTLDALWTLIQGQKKSIQKALAKRLNDSIKAQSEPKVKMTEAEFYAKLDASIESTKTEPTCSMKDNESSDEFIDRLLSSNN